MSATVVVTGGIGSGKSLVCSFFREAGIPVYDSDSAAKSLYVRVPGLVARVSAALGEDVAAPDGGVDRKKLSAAVFADPARREVLENIVWPEVFADFASWKEGCRAPFVAFETALFLCRDFPAGFADEVVLVDAPEAVRIGRAAARDGSAEGAVAARAAAQQADPSDPRVTILIENGGSVESLRESVSRMIETLKNKYDEN